MPPQGIEGLLVWEQRSFVSTHTEGQLLLTESAEAGKAYYTNAQVVGRERGRYGLQTCEQR